MHDTIRIPAPALRTIAHRGQSALERENTCAAFVAAGNRSHYGIETDIHRTKDGRYIVVHDDDTLRVAGVKHVVEETDLDTLRALCLCDLDGAPRGDLMLPTLEEYVAICKHYDKASVLEIKNHFEREDIENVIEIIRRMGWLERTIFISFDLPNMIAVRELLPQQKAQYLTTAFTDDLLALLTRYRLDLDIHYKAITAQNVAACHAAGIEVNVWTVDTPEDARRCIACGVDYLTSNTLERAETFA